MLAICAAFAHAVAARAGRAMVSVIKTRRPVDDIDIFSDDAFDGLSACGAFGNRLIFNGLLQGKHAACRASITILHGIPSFSNVII